MLELTLFGSVAASLHFDGQILVLSLAPRSAELLAFLALGRGRFFQRTELGQSIWGDGEDYGTGSVTTALWRLRKSIERAPAKSGDFITTNRQGAVGLNTTAPINFDVGEFERLTHTALTRQLHETGEADIADLGRAVTLYKDSVLAEFSSDWVLRERERLRRTYLDALSRLMQLGAVRADYESAIHYAQLILYADSLREDVHRELMRFYVLNGQRALALRQFETCRAALKRELAIPPMRETMALYQRITDSAVGQLEMAMREPSRGDHAVIVPNLHRHGDLARPDAALAHPSADAAAHIRAARLLMAQANTELQLSLDLIGP